MSIFGVFGSIFGQQEDTWNKRPGPGMRSITVALRGDETPEQIDRMRQALTEKLHLEGMSPAEQLEYLKKKRGL